MVKNYEPYGGRRATSVVGAAQEKCLMKEKSINQGLSKNVPETALEK